MTGASITDMGGRVLEGWRVSETPGSLTYDAKAATTPVYHQANIGRLRLLLSEMHWGSPLTSFRSCVHPGDVVINKTAPVRAAYVSPSAKRHPVDGNSLIVRGLPSSEAVWVALCLNHSGYEQLLLIESGVLKRIGMRTLASLKFPPAPWEMEGLSVQLRDLLDQAMLTGDNLHRLRVEADAEATAAPRQAHNLSSGSFFCPNAVSNESWLPSAVALRSEQATLREESGWVALGDLAVFGGRARLSRPEDGARALRLSDVGDDLLVSLPDNVPGPDLSLSRALDKPLLPGEVLISTLGSSFRSAYVDDEVPLSTYPLDGWVRLRFRETPAAWALLLSTEPVRTQAARLTVGSVQQFVSPEALRTVLLPVPPRDVRDRWQREVERHHVQRRSLDRRWAALRSELSTVFDSVHKKFRSAPQ